MSFWISHIFCLWQIWFYLVFIFSEVKNIIVFVPDFRLLSGCLVSWLIFCCYLLQTFFVSVFLLKKFREESRRSLSSRIWGRSRFIRAHTYIVLASSRPSTVFDQPNLHQDFPPPPANSSKTHNQTSDPSNPPPIELILKIPATWLQTGLYRRHLPHTYTYCLFSYCVKI